MSDLVLPGAPVARLDGSWYLAVGAGRVPLDDSALTGDLDHLARLVTSSSIAEEAH